MRRVRVFNKKKGYSNKFILYTGEGKIRNYIVTLIKKFKLWSFNIKNYLKAIAPRLPEVQCYGIEAILLFFVPHNEYHQC
jgi:hypothetical protein